MGERFCSSKSFGKAGILGVLRTFQNALLGQKIRPKPKRVVFRGAQQFTNFLSQSHTHPKALPRRAPRRFPAGWRFPAGASFPSSRSFRHFPKRGCRASQIQLFFPILCSQLIAFPRKRQYTKKKYPHSPAEREIVVSSFQIHCVTP